MPFNNIVKYGLCNGIYHIASYMHLKLMENLYSKYLVNMIFISISIIFINFSTYHCFTIIYYKLIYSEVSYE